MASGIQKYIANKTCCIAANVKKTDDKIKYGSEDMICCINKDFMANVFSELLMCNGVPIDSTWYKLSFCVEFIDETPPAYVYGTDLILTTLGQITSYDGNKQVFAYLTGIYNFTNILEVNTELSIVINNAGGNTGDPSIFYNAFYDTVNECINIDIYHDSSWGNTDNVLSYGSIISNLPFDGNRSVTLHEIDSTVSIGTCLTALQLCTIKEWLDKYCKSC